VLRLDDRDPAGCDVFLRLLTRTATNTDHFFYFKKKGDIRRSLTGAPGRAAAASQRLSRALAGLSPAIWATFAAAGNGGSTALGASFAVLTRCRRPRLKPYLQD
jgi:hypothetical protein